MLSGIPNNRGARRSWNNLWCLICLMLFTENVLISFSLYILWTCIITVTIWRATNTGAIYYSRRTKSCSPAVRKNTSRHALKVFVGHFDIKVGILLRIWGASTEIFSKGYPYYNILISFCLVWKTPLYTHYGIRRIYFYYT